MAHETSKQTTRRGSDSRYATRWVKGDGIDIGCGADSLAALSDFFPLMRSLRPWDLPDGDAMLMTGVPDNSFDFVHSSHCLEHLVDPYVSMTNWIRICREGGYIIVTIPDEDLYEQGVWPSTFNLDHKWTFTIAKRTSWSPNSVNLFDLLGRFLDEVDILKVELLDSGFKYGLPRHDQSLGPLSESAIEFVLRKKNRSADRFVQGLAHHQNGRLEEAAAHYGEVLALKPDHIDARYNLGRVLVSQGRPAEAEDLLQAIVAQDERHTPALRLLGTVLEARGDLTGALLAHHKAVSVSGGSAEDFHRLGMLCEQNNLTDSAIVCFDKAIEIDPNHRFAQIFRGHARLKKGDFAGGADGLKWIWQPLGLEDQRAIFADGRPLDGQTILLSADSGLGDSMQFVRYAELLKARGARVVVECQRELVRLFEMSGRIDQVVATEEPLPPHDRRLPMHNLIGAFQTTVDSIPAPIPYLSAKPDDVDMWRQKLSHLPGLKVGIVWAGNPTHASDKRRSVPAELVRPLTDIPGVTLVSLQQQPVPEGLAILDCSAELTDMAATAALIEALDLVIAVDSAIVHLAGGLGQPVWLLNRFDSCWRWLEERSDSPWYPTLRQFRQSAPGAWPAVIDEVARELTALVGASGVPAQSDLIEA